VTDTKAPSILLAYPSCFHYSFGGDRVEVKTALLLLASYLAQYFPVQYADFELTIGRPDSAFQIKRFERKVREYLEKQEFDILALSCWTSLSYKATLLTARICRELYPNRLIVVGGYHPTARPDDFCEPGSVVDYVVVGEGELALKEIADGFKSTGRPSAPTIVKAPTFMPDQFVGHNWDLIDSETLAEFRRQIGTLNIFVSRGCPYECTFCMESLKDQRWRAFTPEQSIREIFTAAERYNPIAVGISDACFGLQRKWRKEFLRRLVDLNPSFWVLFQGRAEHLDEEDVEMLSRLKVQVQLGVESCSPEMLIRMKKTRAPEKYLEVFRRTSHLLSDRGVIHGANIIFNHPGETRETLEQTFAFIDEELKRKNQYLVWVTHGYMHFPGSEVDRHRRYYEEEFGAQFLSPTWWIEDEDQYAGALKTVPSSDLSGEGVTLYRKMLSERTDSLKNALAPTAFNFAAETQYSDWQYDARYSPLVGAPE
jgi:anaerobic magnesium-protoporphyrin IX monomethyl ester cyclase